MKKTLSILGVGVGLILILWYASESSVPRFEPLTPQSALHIRDAIADAVRQEGGERAMQAFRDSYASVSPDIQHNASHILGEALYLASGITGVSTCTEEYNFGCYHGFFSKAIVTEGLDVITALDEVCQNTVRPTACQHGLGHGILEYVGTDKLEEALAICGRTWQPNPIAVCTSGVFMEYNGPLVVTEGRYTTDPRPLKDARNPYAPCDTIAPEFQQSCYHELPQWWKQVYDGGFAQMGTFCADLSNKEHQYACITGIGGIVAPTVEYSPEAVIAACADLPERYDAECLESAAWAIAGNVGDREGAARVCEMLPIERQAYCLESL